MKYIFDVIYFEKTGCLILNPKYVKNLRGIVSCFLDKLYWM